MTAHLKEELEGLKVKMDEKGLPFTYFDEHAILGMHKSNLCTAAIDPRLLVHETATFAEHCAAADSKRRGKNPRCDEHHMNFSLQCIGPFHDLLGNFLLPEVIQNHQDKRR